MLFAPKDSEPSNPLVVSFCDTLEKRVEKIKDRSNNTSPSSAVELIANLNFHGRDIPAYFFDNIDYNGTKSPDDLIVLGNLWSRVKGEKGDRKVDILPPQRKEVGNFVLQYNYIRGFRPKRAAQSKDAPLDMPFNPKSHHFMQPVFKNEEFYSMDMNGIHFDFFLNKYPFAPGHFILTPNKEKCHNQYLDPEKDAGIISTVSEIMEKGVFGRSMRLGYNSHGAHASLNHLHFQGFFIEDNWQPPLEEEVMKSVSRNQNKTHCFRNAPYNAGMWVPYSEQGMFRQFLKEIKKEDMHYNLYYMPEGIALFMRRNQNEPSYLGLLEKSPFTTGYAFFEMMGEIICPDKTAFETSTEDETKTLKQIIDLYSSLR
jgi:diadenosine tetraphosphate (Ap4A) HIT family hydrolase